MSKRPNFILFMTDQHRVDYLGCMGHPVLKTPNIDAIAQSGTIWNNFYVTSPVCQPNRASFMTCRMPSSHGVRNNGIPLDHRNVSFVELLRDAGYKTALIGKSHLQNFSGQPPMVDRPETRDGYHRATGDLSEAIRHDHDTYRSEWPGQNTNVATPFYGFDHVELVTRHGDNCRGDYRDWLLERRPDADSLIGAANQLPHDYSCPQAIRTKVPEELYSTSYIAERAEAWLQAHNEADQPFFLMVSFPDPHHPFNPPGKYWDMYHPDDMDTPEAYRINDWTPPPHVQGAFDERNDGTANLKGMGTLGVSEQEAREARALTCGMITMIDDAVGRVRRASAAQSAVTVFTTDHGDHLGDHRLLLKGVQQYDQLTHVPFIWSDPDDPAPRRIDAFGQTHDIGVTILDRARVEPAIGMQGQSLLHGGRSNAFIQFDRQATTAGVGKAPRVHTLRSGNWRMSVFGGLDWGELYDLKSDPGEFTNLWDDPDFATQKATLIEELLHHEIMAVDRVPFPTALA